MNGLGIYQIGPLNSIADVLSGYAFQSQWFCSEGDKIIRIGDIVDGEISQENCACFDSTKYKIPEYCITVEGDILMALSGATTGKIGIVKLKDSGLYVNQRVAIIRGKTQESKRYLKYVFTGENLQKLLLQAGGAAQANLSPNSLRAMDIPLPTLPEQKRIAAILDKADAIRRKRQQAIKRADDFLRATFLDMFGDPVTNPKGWDRGSLSNLVHLVKDGPHVSPTYSVTGIPFLSTRHLRPGKILWEDLKYINRDDAEKQWRKCKPEKGDILYSKGGTTGIAVAYDSDREIAVWVHVALLKTNHEKANPIWLENMLNTSYCYAQSQFYTHGITNQDLGLTRMVNIKMYLPPLEQQQNFAQIVYKIKRMSEKSTTARTAADSLFTSLTQRAFRGEL